MSENQDELLTERWDRVVALTLNRPERLNALSERMCCALAAALEKAGKDSGIRAIILRGAGGSFCAGGDVKQMGRDIDDGRPAAFFGSPLDAIHAAAIAIRHVEKPVIAALQGAVAGAGLNLALCCDYRIAAENAVLIQAFTNIGLVPDTGGTFLLPRLVGFAKATQLLFEGRPVDAWEAEQLRLVDRVVPLTELEAATNALASSLAARPTRALGLTKRLLNESVVNTFEQQLDAERQIQQILGADSADFVEGVRAFLERRRARFIGQ